MRNWTMLLGLCAAGAALAVQFAPVPYVDRGLTNVLLQAKGYTDAHVPEIDLSPYVAKSNANLRADTATNVVWCSVLSNGIEYVYAYSNDTNMLHGTGRSVRAGEGE